MAKKHSFELNVGLNPFEFKDNAKFKHILVQPEYRYWFCERFNGHFLGIHGHLAQFNAGGIDIPIGRLDVLKDHRYEGWLVGGGLSYGYQWVLGNRWNLEASIGAGYAYIDYDRFNCPKCGEKTGEGKEHYFGITKASLSIIYLIK